MFNDSGRYTIVENLTAKRDPSSSYTEGSTYQLRIGDPNKTLIGDHEYEITYTIVNAIAGFSEQIGTGSDERTELYRNVIGTERETSIAKSDFSLYVPKEIDFEANDFYLIYGKQGEKTTE